MLKHRLRPMWGLKNLSTVKATLKGIQTFRATRRADLEASEPGVPNEIRFAHGMFDEGRAAE